MRLRIILLLPAFLLVQANLQGQVSTYGSTTETHEVTSKANKEYSLKITLPTNYSSDKSYKTLYYLDSWWLSEMIQGSYAVLNLSNKVDDVILVGISVKGALKDWNVHRTLDFTPSDYDLSVMKFTMHAGTGENSIELNPETTGEASIFLEFLETKAIPFVEDKYPNVTKDRGLLGHSYGGLFAFYTLQQKPQLFSDYIMISPSLWWNKPEMINEARFANFLADQNHASVHFSYGGSESKLIVSPCLQAHEILTAANKENFDYQFTQYENADHHSILSQAIYDGILFLYHE